MDIYHIQKNMYIQTKITHRLKTKKHHTHRGALDTALSYSDHTILIGHLN